MLGLIINLDFQSHLNIISRTIDQNVLVSDMKPPSN